MVTGGKDPRANPDEYSLPGKASYFAYKGFCGSTRPRPRWHLTRHVYGHETKNVQAAECDKSIDYICIWFHGKQTCQNQLTGKIHSQNPVEPGWRQPLTGVFAVRDLSSVTPSLRNSKTRVDSKSCSFTRFRSSPHQGSPDAEDREVPEQVCYLLLTDSGWV